MELKLDLMLANLLKGGKFSREDMLADTLSLK